MGIKEQGLLEYLEDNTRYADLMNGTIFHGKQVVKAEYLRDVQRKKRVFYRGKIREQNPDNLQKRNSSKDSDTKLMYLERERDMLRFHNKAGERFLLACEAQSRADYKMPVRKFTYDGIEYSNQIKGRKSRFPLVPIFHQVLYLGEERWLSGQTLQEMMDIPECVQSFTGILPDYRINLVDIHEQDPELFRTEWKDIFRLMGQSRKKKN